MNANDISSLFTRYLKEDPETPTTPFCDLPLSPETTTILPPLLKLNSPDFQYWTVGSQPAVDGASSGDKVHGWGPGGGYVFQKSFVEFFVKPDEVERILSKIAAAEAGLPSGALISMYASNKKVRWTTVLENLY